MKQTRSRGRIDAEIFERQARICKAFAHAARLQILDLLGQGEQAGSFRLTGNAGPFEDRHLSASRDPEIGGRSGHTSQWEASSLLAGYSRSKGGMSVDP